MPEMSSPGCLVSISLDPYTLDVLSSPVNVTLKEWMLTPVFSFIEPPQDKNGSPSSCHLDTLHNMDGPPDHAQPDMDHKAATRKHLGHPRQVPPAAEHVPVPGQRSQLPVHLPSGDSTPGNEYPFTRKTPNLVDNWDEWTGILSHTPEESQELDLLGLPQLHIV